MKLIMKVLAMVLCCFSLFQGVAFSAQDKAPVVTIDVRTEAEWKEGHLEGAVLIPHDRIEEGIKGVAPDKNSRIYLYCRSGHRSGLAMDALKKAGYLDLVNLGTLDDASKSLNRAVIK